MFCARTALSLNKLELSCSVRTDGIQRGSHCSESFKVELFCSVRTDCAQRGSHCSEPEQCQTIYFSAYGLRSARLALFSVGTKWKYLVSCARTVLCEVRIVLSLSKVELSCSVRMDSVQRG